MGAFWDWLTKGFRYYDNIEEETKTTETKTVFEKDYSEPTYNKKSIITKCEQDFYNKLNRCFSNKYIVSMQVPLSSIIKKESEKKCYANELYRTIDFALIDKKNFMPLILIELNDQTHKQKARISRDIKVKELCNKAGIKIVSFWTNYPNEEIYIKNRIEKLLKS